MVRCALMLKYLRIAVTALSLTACVMLIALWVRSYSYRDVIDRVRPPRYRVVESHRGRIEFSDMDIATNLGNGWPAVAQNWTLKTYTTEYNVPRQRTVTLRPSFHRSPLRQIIVVPHWLPASLAAIFVVAPWIPWSPHFSLRTLLIATTLVAVALAIVTLSR
jgi:hypothetical protein